MLLLGEEHSETIKAFNYDVSVYCINNNTISISLSHTRVPINHETLMVVMVKLKAKLNYAGLLITVNYHFPSHKSSYS